MNKEECFFVGFSIYGSRVDTIIWCRTGTCSKRLLWNRMTLLMTVLLSTETTPN